MKSKELRKIEEQEIIIMAKKVLKFAEENPIRWKAICEKINEESK